MFIRDRCHTGTADAVKGRKSEASSAVSENPELIRPEVSDPRSSQIVFFSGKSVKSSGRLLCFFSLQHHNPDERGKRRHASLPRGLSSILQKTPVKYTHRHTHTRMHARTNTHTHRGTRTHARTHTNTHARTHTNARTHAHKRTHARTHTHTHPYCFYKQFRFNINTISQTTPIKHKQSILQTIAVKHNMTILQTISVKHKTTIKCWQTILVSFFSLPDSF